MREDLQCIRDNSCEYIAIEITNPVGPNIIIVNIYRPPDVTIASFISKMEEILVILTSKKNLGKIIITGDTNIDLFKFNETSCVNNFFNSLVSFDLLPTILQPTRVTSTTATLIDNIFINFSDNIQNAGIMYDDLSDHFPTFLPFPFNKLSYNRKSSADPQENQSVPKRSFTNSNYKLLLIRFEVSIGLTVHLVHLISMIALTPTWYLTSSLIYFIKYLMKHFREFLNLII